MTPYEKLPRHMQAILRQGRMFKDLDYKSYKNDQATETDNLGDAEVTSSHRAGTTDLHTVMLDLDIPAYLIPSSTPGHSHLYLDVAVPWRTYEKLLAALVECQVIERGYYEYSKKRKATFLRLPWITKGYEKLRFMDPAKIEDYLNAE